MDRRKAIKRAALFSGMAISLPITSAVMSGCLVSKKQEFTPRIFSQEQISSLDMMANVILPSAPDSPGASNLGLSEFIDLMVNDCFSQERQDAVVRGLDEWAADFKSINGSSLGEADHATVATFVQERDRKAFAEPSERTRFYREVKQLILLGYLTSEEVMTNHLDYHPIPGEYRSCIPYDGQKAYVDNKV